MRRALNDDDEDSFQPDIEEESKGADEFTESLYSSDSEPTKKKKKPAPAKKSVNSTATSANNKRISITTNTDLKKRASEVTNAGGDDATYVD